MNVSSYTLLGQRGVVLSRVSGARSLEAAHLCEEMVVLIDAGMQ